MLLKNRVLVRRTALGISQHELSRRTGLSRVTIRAIERDPSHNVSAEVQRRLAEALDDPGLFWLEAAYDVGEDADTEEGGG